VESALEPCDVPAAAGVFTRFELLVRELDSFAQAAIAKGAARARQANSLLVVLGMFVFLRTW